MSKANVSFGEFLRTGCLGPLRCGMTKADIERVIGRPETLEDIENYPEGKSIWSYFLVSIRFDGEFVDDIGIGFSWWDGRMPAWLNPQGFFPSKDTKMATV